MLVNEGYSASAPDLSSLVTKLKRGQPDVIFHTGYNPDITLFLREARELGLKFSTLIGHGAGLRGIRRRHLQRPAQGRARVDDQSYVVWPKARQQREPVLKLPANSPYAAK